MKKLFIALIYFVVLLPCVKGQTCDRLFETTLTYHNEFLNIHYDNVVTGNYYKIFHRTTPGETVNTSLGVIDIKRPIIVIEGYDIFYQESCDEIYADYITYSNLGDNLRYNGFDIITYNLSAPTAALQPNALVFAKFIEFINGHKTGDEELIIMGASMGGLLTRYALTYMEQHDIQHQTKLFMSFDSPQKGAYAPLSMQALLTDPAVLLAALIAAAAQSPDLRYLIDCFLSDGTLQMLTHHVWEIEDGYAYPPPHHGNFLNELTSMNSCGGYPINCKRVAISNGSLNGALQEGLNLPGNYSGNPAVWLSIDHTGGLIFRGLNTVPGIDNWMLGEGECVYRSASECNSGNNYYLKSDGLPLDHAPGGYFEWYEYLVTELNKINGVTVAIHNNDNACFIPTISALDLNTNNLLLNVGSYTKNQILADSPFDDIWWNLNHTNMMHTSYYHPSLGFDYFALSNFIEDQIYLSQSENYAQR